MLRFFLSCLLVGCALLGYSQSSSKPSFPLTGYVRDSLGNPIAGVTLLVQENRRVATTDRDGLFALSLDAGTYTVRLSHIGHATQTRTVTLTGATTLDVTMAEDTRPLQAQGAEPEPVSEPLPPRLPNGRRAAFPLTGYVRDSLGKPLSGVNIFVQNNRRGTSTDRDGFFTIPLEAGTYTVRFSHLGHITAFRTVTVRKLTLLEVKLADDVRYLNEVTVMTEAADRNVQKVEIGATSLNIKNIKQIPPLLGEVDVIRSLLLLPGVTTVGEGATGLNVRGGSIDQNLILLDDAPIFNSSHLLGFFSIFNPDAVRDLTLYRGGISAQYGGRASSVLDIKLKEPNVERTAVSGGIGLISSRLTVEGPLTKNKKWSYLLAGRGSFNDFLFRLAPDRSIRNTKARFYDITGRVKFQPDEKNTFWLTGYTSHDLFKLSADSLSGIDVNASSTQFVYGTTTATARWNHSFSDAMNLNVAAIFADYNSTTSAPDPANAFALVARIRHRQLKADWSYAFAGRHQVKAGVSMIRYNLQPNTLTPGPESNVLPVTTPNQQGYEAAVYAEDEYKLSDATSVLVGLRYAQFWNVGPTELRRYATDVPRFPESITSREQVGAGGTVASYGGLEPRLALRINTGPGSSVKLGYNRMRQFIQLVTNTTAALPSSRWTLSDNNIRPQYADQWSAGWFKNVASNTVELSAEVYYKQLHDAIDYRDGARLLLNPVVETEILQGRGRAYGLELLARKNAGRWTGWASYTYARTFLEINEGPAPEQQVNNGQWYPANFDKPHTLNVIANYRPSLRFSLSLNFTYSTGRPITFPYAKARVGGAVVPIFVNRNQERIPDYHRLDFAMTFDQDPEKAKTRRFKSSWTFAIYNVYAHRNAYSVFFNLRSYAESDAYKLSIFGTMFPSLTYNFQF